MRLFSKMKSLVLAGAAALSLTGVTTTAVHAQAGTQFIGQLMVFGGNFCPREWAYADGSLIAISSNTALFSLYGTTYGGDGRTTFGLPDLRGRFAINMGSGPGLTTHRLGARGGLEDVTLLVNNLPSHSHSVNSVNLEGDRARPGSELMASGSELFYHDGPANATMDSGMLGMTGNNIAFSTQSPYLAMSICVAMYGIYPSRS